MRFGAIFLVLSMMMFGCRPAKKVQKIQEVISKVDTVAVVVVPDDKKPEAATSTKDIFEKVIKNKIDFTTFNAKARLEYEGTEGGEEATAFIRLRKDSAIWLSLRGALGIEGARILITKDSVKVMNLLKKYVQYRSITYVHEITGLPLDFTTLQDLIVGNPVFIDTNIVSYKADPNDALQILMGGKVFKNLVSLDNSDYRILHSKLNDTDTVRNRSCDITFSSYENTGGVLFSKSRKISVAEPSKAGVTIDFKEYSFNRSLTFPFNIPKNYKRL